MPIDTSRTIEIESSPLKLALLFGAGVLMTAGGAVLAFGWFPELAANAYARFIGYMSLVFFAACTMAALMRLFTARGPVITIGPQGIRDTRVAADFIPWSAVTGISTWEHRRQKIVVLAVEPATEASLLLTRIARWTRSANRALGADGLAIAAQGLKIDHDTLLATVTAYWQTARGGAAGPAHAP
jgi:hypothetical protein